jgi:hypothetical protein
MMTLEARFEADVEFEISMLVNRYVPWPLAVQIAHRNGMTHILLLDPRDGREATISMSTASASSVSLLRDAIRKTLTRVWGNA